MTERPGMTCARCGKDTGNNHQGHYWRLCKALLTRGVPTHAAIREPHFCCPGDCELEPSMTRTTERVAPSADLFKAHDFDRMTCYDHEGNCCPEGGCHDLSENQYEHYATLCAAQPAVTEVKAAAWDEGYAADPTGSWDGRQGGGAPTNPYRADRTGSGA